MSLVSDNIRYLRKLNGLTQEQFSRKINIKRSLLGAYEEGRANPNQQNMQAIAKAFNTTVELLTRQDLRKIRETPNLSIPLGQASKPIDSRSSSIRTDGKLDADENDPFQHPDFPDIFAQPSPSIPEPQPLSSVLNKYYKTQEESRRPTEHPIPGPPVITSPIRPEQSRQPASFQSVQPSVRPINQPVQPAVDELFGQSSIPRSTMPAPRQEEPLTFNNVYKDSFGSVPASGGSQSVAPSIPVVMQRLFGEYRQRHQQPDFLYRLPAMQLPTLPEGHYRAFEAGDDFVFPGALLVGRFIRNWFDISDGKQYVLLVASAGSGICCRRVYNQVKIKGTLLLTADRADIPNLEIALKEVLEVWEVCAFVSQTMPPLPPNMDRLRQLIEEMRFEVERL
ncbi:helix-turn-helix domain-containing protein [Spirosoma gilvum]